MGHGLVGLGRHPGCRRWIARPRGRRRPQGDHRRDQHRRNHQAGGQDDDPKPAVPRWPGQLNHKRSSPRPSDSCAPTCPPPQHCALITSTTTNRGSSPICCCGTYSATSLLMSLWTLSRSSRRCETETAPDRSDNTHGQITAAVLGMACPADDEDKGVSQHPMDLARGRGTPACRQLGVVVRPAAVALRLRGQGPLPRAQPGPCSAGKPDPWADRLSQTAARRSSPNPFPWLRANTATWYQPRSPAWPPASWRRPPGRTAASCGLAADQGKTRRAQ